MDFQKTFATNEKLEQEGRWFPLGDGRVLIARTGNPKHREIMRAKLRPINHSIQKGLVDDEEQDRVIIEGMAKSILLNWENFTDGGKPVQYSYKTAVEMLTRYKDFRDFVAKTADDMQNFKEELAAATQGNSPSDSSGSSDGDTKSSS